MSLEALGSVFPVILAALAFPLITLLGPLCAARLLVDRLESGNRAARRKAQHEDTLALHSLYEGTARMADRIEVLEMGLRPAEKGESI